MLSPLEEEPLAKKLQEYTEAVRGLCDFLEEIRKDVDHISPGKR